MPPVLDSTLVQGSVIRNSTVKKGNPASSSNNDNIYDESGCKKKSTCNKNDLNKIKHI